METNLVVNCRRQAVEQMASRAGNNPSEPRGRHDREEARTHAADIVAVLKAQLDPPQFAQAFVREFLREPLLGLRVLRIFHDFFREPTSPGFLVYEEHLAANIPAGRNVREELQREVQRSHHVVSLIFPIPEFYGLAAAIDDSCDWERIPKLTEEYLAALENARIRITQTLALQFLPSAAFGGAFLRGTFLMTSATGSNRETLRRGTRDTPSILTISRGNSASKS
jgi:hypothetical protein